MTIKQQIRMNKNTAFTVSTCNTYALMLDDLDSIQPKKERERIIIKSIKNQSKTLEEMDESREEIFMHNTMLWPKPFQVATDTGKMYLLMLH